MLALVDRSPSGDGDGPPTVPAVYRGTEGRSGPVLSGRVPACGRRRACRQPSLAPDVTHAGFAAEIAAGDPGVGGRSILAGRALVAVVPVLVLGVSKLTASVSAG
jgi:hypothetical protein